MDRFDELSLDIEVMDQGSGDVITSSSTDHDNGFSDFEGFE